ncbi:hypothetical protein HDU76_001172 [Blyttiomyces sp. JEL0837]|nr:hypothetical protein HDU76_001172 [Blyttiomyces sp. JEL0837]
MTDTHPSLPPSQRPNNESKSPQNQYPRLKSSILTNTPEYKANLAAMLQLCSDLSSKLNECTFEGKEKDLKRHLKRGQLLARDRIELLLDPDSPFLELLPLAGYGMDDMTTGGSVVGGIGLVCGVEVMITANVPTLFGGASNEISVQKGLRLKQIALENRLPTISLSQTAGANLSQQSRVFHAGGAIFRNLALTSKLNIPTCTVVFGSSTAGGAYAPGMSDYVIMVKDQAQVFLGGPPLVKMATGEIVDAESLGGALMHSKKSGLSDQLANDEKEAIRMAREWVMSLDWVKAASLPPRVVSGLIEEPFYHPDSVLGVVQANIRIPFEVRDVIARLVDGSRFLDFKPLYGPNLVTGWAHIHGFPIGIIANDSVFFPEEANKATQFIQLCNMRSHPILFLSNITGFMVGKTYEESGIIKAGSRFINAISNSKVPHITVIIGASYGAGNYAMCGRAYAPRFLFSWPNSKCSVMGPDQLAGVMEIVMREAAEKAKRTLDEDMVKTRLSLFKEAVDAEQDVYYTTARCLDDAVIDPRQTRDVLGICLEVIHGNVVRGGNLYDSIGSMTAEQGTKRSITTMAMTSTSSTSSAIISSSSSAHVYVKPPPPQEILDEDSYIQAVSDIIERDFFPSLKRLKVQNEFLDAVQAGDLPKAKELGMQLHRIATGRVGTDASKVPSTPGSLRVETPVVTGFTPMASQGSETPRGSESSFQPHATIDPAEPTADPKINTSMSLDSFQSRYTSEDNASFNLIMERTNEEKKRKYHWYFDKEKGQLLLDNGDGGSGAGSGSGDGSLALTAGASSTSAVKLIESGDGGFAKPIDTWKYKARNELMYYPSGAPQTLADLKEQRGPPKAINHSATRLPTTHTTKDVIEASKQAADRLQTQQVWRDMAAATPALFPGHQSNDPVSSGKSYDMVPSTPSLEPHADIDPSELMTWGMIEGTPLLVDSGGDHGSSAHAFKIPPTPRREVLGNKLAEEATRSLRHRTLGKGSLVTGSAGSGSSLANTSRGKTPTTSGSGASPSPWAASTPRNMRAPSPLMRQQMLSPAAQKLLASKSGGSLFAKVSKGIVGGADAQLRASYSSTPGRTPTLGKTGGVATPGASRGSVSLTPSLGGKSMGVGKAAASSSERVEKKTSGPSKTSASSSITDNLLNF